MRYHLARLIVRIVALAAPWSARSRLVREWDAELWHEVRRGSRRGEGMAPLRLALGVVADVRALRDLHGSAAERRTMSGWIDGWGREVAAAVRGLLRSPGFTTATVVTLGLGMGGSVAIFTLLDRVVLDPLPYPESGRLVSLTNRVPGVGPGEVWTMSTAQYVFFDEHARSLDAVGLYRGMAAIIQTPTGPQRVFGWAVTAGMFPLLGGRASLGRVIDERDDRPGGPNVVVLSHGFWRRRFGEARDVIGRAIQVNGRPAEVIGVMEPGVRIPDASPGFSGDLWVPLRIDRQGAFGNNHVFPMIARLAPGTDPEAAEIEIERLTARLPERFPDVYSQRFFDRYGFRTVVTPLKEAVVGEVSRNLWILFGAVGLVLVMAWANVANLFAVRVEVRRRELAIRSALGAGRAAIARYLLAEALALSLGGGALALVVAFWGVPALASVAPDTLPRIDGLGLDGRGVVFTAAMSLLAGVALAAVALLRHVRGGVFDSLGAGGRSSTPGRRQQRLRSTLIVIQVALALTLVAGAGLLVESLRHFRALDPGVDPEGVLTAEVFLTPGRYGSDVEIWAAYDAILDRVRAIPGVSAAGMSAELPVEGDFGCTVQGFADRAVYERLSSAGMTTCAGQEPTTPGYFEATGIGLVSGRTFTRADNDDPTRGVVVVSGAFAERFWPGEDPLGKGVAPSGRTVPPFYRVIGVVEDVPSGSLDGPPAIAVYYPIVHNPDAPGNWGWWRPTAMKLVVRTGLADPASITDEVRRIVQAVDPTIAMANPRTMTGILAESAARFTFTTLLLGIAAAVALALAAVGLYGVVSYIVSGRTREIGTRIAIGAGAGEVVGLFVRRSLTLAGIGLVLGLLLSFTATRVMRGLLFGVEATDPGIMTAAVGLVAVVTLVASWIPARRITRVDPVEALRAE